MVYYLSFVKIQVVHVFFRNHVTGTLQKYFCQNKICAMTVLSKKCRKDYANCCGHSSTLFCLLGALMWLSYESCDLSVVEKIVLVHLYQLLFLKLPPE